MVIVLPWPDKRLTPNAKRRSHWTVYRPAEKKAREDACYATYAAAGAGMRDTRQSVSGSHKIPVTVTFYPPDRRHRDDDGMVGSFKHYRDGIADALAINDRRFAPHYVFAEPEKPGRIEVRLGITDAGEPRKPSPRSVIGTPPDETEAA